MSLTPTKFTQDSATEYSKGEVITSVNLNSIQKGILYNNTQIETINDNLQDYNNTISNLTEQINNYRVIITNVTVTASQWIKVNTTNYTKYPYRAALTLSNVTVDMTPDIFFPQAMIDDLILAPTCETYNGGIWIYSVNKAANSYTIPKIILWKED